MKFFGDRLREAIYVKNNSNAVQTAKAIGVERKAVYRYISGQTYPTVDTLIKICEFTKVSPDWLLFGEEERQR